MKISLLYFAGLSSTSTIFFVRGASSKIRGGAADAVEVEYGVDVSWPVHHYGWNTSSVRPFGDDAEERYEEFMEGCRKFFPKTPELCDVNDSDRIDMNRWQPEESVNYTETGYKKIKCPTDVWEKIQKFWEANFDATLEDTDSKDFDNNKRNGDTESWPKGNVYMNPWGANARMLDMKEEKYEHGGKDLTDSIFEAAGVTLEEWTQQRLHPTSIYGVRIYPHGSILTPHVDRNPLVTSAIVNVGQDVNEPWPLEVYGRDGIARNVTLEPGEMVLYESQSTIHGRPFPLNGKYYANCFIHFAPVGPLHSEEIVDTYDVLDSWDESAQDYDEDLDEREEDEILDTMMQMAEEIEEGDEETEEEEEELIDAVVDTIARDLNEEEEAFEEGEYYDESEEGEYYDEEYEEEEGEYYDEEYEEGEEGEYFNEEHEYVEGEEGEEWIDEEEEEEDL